MENETSLWNKKQDELTVGDTMKVAGAVTIISIAVAFAPLAVITGVSYASKKIQERREAKETKKD